MQRKLERIYREHRQGLFTLALSITRCHDLAEDAVQDAFMRLCRSASEPTGDLVAYTFASVRNAALELVRRSRQPLRASVSIFSPPRPDPAAAAIEAERQQRVREAVEALEESQREVIVLRLYAGLTFQQIAEALAEPLATVASRYRRALLRIKDIIGESI